MKPLHILAGLAALTSGAVALYALKGATLHRRSGMVFVYTMLVMSASGAVLAALKAERANVIAGVFTFYLVTTALLTVRRPTRYALGIDAGALLVALTAGIAFLKLSFDASRSPTGTIDGEPAAPGFMFGAVALLAALGDIRMMRAGGLQGSRRIARHLWRMCFALFIAAASLFLGQPQVFPGALRRSGLLPIPVLLVLLLMFYWMARLRLPGWRPRAGPGA